ncbi:tetratricopeptide repeat-containing sulfotransferase family protein [Actibacterium ureilyticum]|uniref:tetratricopeptide repeat-containing sulfotransferase family protein n=1 Tax=Actibacterium ureilyticum TaxID=1590614 RepID=UPI001595F918|nr:tetratricopeptide repeat-containing sulfotransferase family protein [Actibacterium ureilyticum]
MLPLSHDRLRTLYREAAKLQSAGQLDEAEKRYRLILQTAPRNAEVQFEMAKIEVRRQDYDRALTHLEIARSSKPKEMAIWRQMAEIFGVQKDAAKSKQFLKELRAAGLPAAFYQELEKKLNPTGRAASRVSVGAADPKAIQAAIKSLQAGKPDEAEARVRKLLEQHADLPVLHNILGSALGAQGRLPEARPAFEKALKLQPDYTEARFLYGRLLLQLGEHDAAEQHLRRVLKEMPNHVHALGNLGLALCRKGEAEAGIVALRRSLEKDPKQPEVRLVLGTTLTNSQQADEAVAVLEEALNQGDTRGIVHIRLAQAYVNAGRLDDAKRQFEIAEGKEDGKPVALSAHAMHLQSLGDFAQAERKFREAIALDPRRGETYRTFGASYRFKPDDPLMAQMETLFQDPELNDTSRMHLGFALARAMEQNKEYNRVFTYLRPANDLMAARYPYDIQARAKTIRKLQAAFADTDFTTFQVDDTTDYAPIFVTGMPRSGTTLVEQILSSHSTVTGAGEVAYAVGMMSGAMLCEDGETYKPFNTLPADLVRGFGQKIEAHLRALAPDTPRVTDKSIQTYMLMGAIKVAMPKARFVLVRRDPRDLLFSIYKNFFREGTHTYAYDQRMLGLHYRQFLDMVAFWRQKMPGGFHEIQYEELIANPEDQARKLLAACDLEWEDQCLSFHENKREVRTLSLHQVRQPIYTSSMQAWKRYEDDLAELTEALGDAV